MANDLNQFVRLRIRLPEGLPAGEVVWGVRVSEGSYRLSSAPFLAYEYAEGDVVRCVIRNGQLDVVECVENSGNGTIRLFFDDVTLPAAQSVLKELGSVGCTYEVGTGQLVAVTVPRELEIPFSQLANYLNQQDAQVLAGWEIGKRLTRRKPL